MRPLLEVKEKNPQDLATMTSKLQDTIMGKDKTALALRDEVPRPQRAKERAVLEDINDITSTNMVFEKSKKTLNRLYTKFVDCHMISTNLCC